MEKIESALLRQQPGDVPDATERRCGYDQPQYKAPRRPALAAASFEFRDARLGKLKLLYASSRPGPSACTTLRMGCTLSAVSSSKAASRSACQSKSSLTSRRSGRWRCLCLLDIFPSSNLKPRYTTLPLGHFLNRFVIFMACSGHPQNAVGRISGLSQIAWETAVRS